MLNDADCCKVRLMDKVVCILSCIEVFNHFKMTYLFSTSVRVDKVKKLFLFRFFYPTFKKESNKMNINLYLLIKFNYHCTDDSLSSFLLAYPLTWNLTSATLV